MKVNYKSVFILLFTATIWGVAFVAQDVAAEHLPSFTITGVRSLIGFAALMSIVIIKSKIKKENIIEKDIKKRKQLIFASIICGVCFAFAYNFQQFGINLYPQGVSVSGRAGFLTGLYVLFVPIIGYILLKKKIKINVFISLILAVVGLYMLCFSKGINNVYLGDLIVLLCGVFFALQIIIVDKYNNSIDIFKFGAYELLVCGIISMILAFIFETVVFKDILKAILPLLYLGVVSCGLAGVLQIFGQKLSNNPTVDSIVMSFESVFALLGGLIIRKQIPTLNEVIGCVIMFSAIILSQITFFTKKQMKELKIKGEENV